MSKAIRGAIVPGVFLVAAAACFWPLVRHPGDLLVGTQRGGLNDTTGYYLGNRDTPRRIATRWGQPPFWNPTSAAGAPYLGNPQSACFYPPNWLFWLVGARRLIAWFLVGHHVVAGIGAYGLARRLGCARLGATCAGVAYLGSPVLLARTGEGHLGSLGVLAWAPWAFWMYERYRSRARHGEVGLAVVLALAILAGHIQEAYYLVLVLTCLCLFDAARLAGRGGGPEAGSLLLRWPLVGLATAGLVLVELIPMVIFARHSARGAGLFSVTTERSSAGPASLLQLLNPFALGRPEDFHGPGTYFWESLCHFGTVAQVLAVLGLIAGGRAGRPVGRWAVVGVVAFVFALGKGTPFYPILAAVVPGVSAFRFPCRALFLSALAVAVLSGFGIDAIATAARERAVSLRATLKRGVSVVAALVVLAWLVGGLQSGRYLSEAGAVPMSALRLAWDATLAQPGCALWATAALGLAAVAALRPDQAVRAGALLVALVLADSALFARAILRTAPQAALRTHSPALATLSTRLGGARVLARQAALSDREALEHGLRKVEGYDPIPLTRTLAYVAETQLDPSPIQALFGIRPIDLSRASKPLLDLLGVRYAVLLKADRAPTERLGWHQIETGQLPTPVSLRGAPARSLEYQLWENPDALPRAFVVGAVRTPKAGEDPRAVLRTIDPRRAVLLDLDSLPPGPREAFHAARLTEDTPDRVVVEVETARPGYLVLSDAWYPGWSALVDGRRAALAPANLAFRAVALPRPGKHRVEFSYRPTGLALGGFLACLTILVMIGASVPREERADSGP